MKINTLAIKNPYLDKADNVKQKQKIVKQISATPLNNVNNTDKINIASAVNINKGTIIDIKI